MSKKTIDPKNFVTQVQKPGEQEEPEQVNMEEGDHIRGDHTIDPKIVAKLEQDLQKNKAGGTALDPIFTMGLPDASMVAGSTSFAATSIFSGSTSFTMESFTENTLTAIQQGDGTTLQGTETQIDDGGGNACCGKKNTVDIGESPTLKTYENGALLPPQSADDKGKICLVLDLDETLIHSSFLAIPHADYRFALGVESNPVGVFVCVRPGAEKFLRELGQLYELVIFTASVKVYADPVIDFIDKGRVVKHRLYREACTDFGGNFIKDLSRLNRNIEKVIIIDNSSVAYLLQPYNAIAITSWFDDPTDNELFVIMDFLKNHHRAKNVYTILNVE